MLKLRQRRLRVTSSLLSLLVLSLITGLTINGVGRAEGFANSAFEQVWERSDKAVAEGKANRTWLWGPQPFANRQEAYAETPGGLRIVQYFDKSRMEITNPGGDKTSRWYVTNGLLTVELVTGRMQSGDSSFETRSPSQIPVGGDPDNPGPTYASFARLVSLNGSNRAEQKSGFVSESVDRAGKTAQASATDSSLARYAYYEPNLGHNVPDVFWNWLQKLDEDWVFAMGLPISEPYWAKFVVGGVERDLLVQLFERRVLTYNPANATQWQVEMGNIGQHYFKWRYNQKPTDPTASSSPGSNAGNLTPPAPGSGATPTSTLVPTTRTTTAEPSSTGSTSAGPTPTGTSTGPTSTPTLTPVVSSDEEKKLADLINQYRVQHNLPSLQIDNRLAQATHWHSEDMAKNNYFSHIDSLGRDYPQRLGDFGYRTTPQNETVLANFAAQQVFDLWKEDPAAKVLLDSRFTVFGVGYAYQADSSYKHYWSICFGAK